MFCIGRNKTGTTSLEKVFFDWGYRIGDQIKAELLLKQYKTGSWKSIIDYCKTADAFQDAPFSWPYTWLVLHEHFPAAKFILTVRESEDWYKSLTSYHSKLFADGERIPTREDLMKATYRYPGYIWESNRAVWKTPENDIYNKAMMIENYERHNEDVRHFFKNEANFIELDVSQQGCYQRLADFLGKKPLQENFPHLNKTY